MARVLKAITLALLLIGAVAQAAAPPVVVSSKLSSESAMLGQMIRLLLEDRGIPTIDRMTLGATPVVRKALLAGEIDLLTPANFLAAYDGVDPLDQAGDSIAAGEFGDDGAGCPACRDIVTAASAADGPTASDVRDAAGEFLDNVTFGWRVTP